MTRLYYIDTDVAIQELEVWEPEKYEVIQVTINDDGSYVIWGTEYKFHYGNSEVIDEGSELDVPESWLKSVAYEVEYDEDDEDEDE
ncbi:MAG: hypothetical protein KHY96_11365 [Lachnospiraceae bacterium]|nr:hypothetical protein [Lachnospiraceae bacterium]